MYKVKNISPDVRKFARKGKNILISPNKFILTEYPPKECSVWEITVEKIKKVQVEKTEETKIEKVNKTHIEKIQSKKIHIEKKEKRKLNRRNKKWQQ